VASIYTSGSIMLQAIARKRGSLSFLGDRFVGGKGVAGFGPDKLPGFDGTSSNLAVAGHSQILSLYKHHGIWGGENGLRRRVVGSVILQSLKEFQFIFKIRDWFWGSSVKALLMQRKSTAQNLR
jgi:hypothetical protein